MNVKVKSPLTAVIQRSEKYFVALCPELDVVSQGKTVEEARRNITEAVELFLETASPSEVKRRLSKETYIAPLEVTFG
jgi:predicted RNase H-like HicB family nuclease